MFFWEFRLPLNSLRFSPSIKSIISFYCSTTGKSKIIKNTFTIRNGLLRSRKNVSWVLENRNLQGKGQIAKKWSFIEPQFMGQIVRKWRKHLFAHWIMSLETFQRYQLRKSKGFKTRKIVGKKARKKMMQTFFVRLSTPHVAIHFWEVIQPL